MQAHVFVEESNTTGEDRDKPVKEYYEGLFDIVTNLYDKLAEMTDAQLHVLSNDYGVARGEETMSVVHTGEQNPVGKGSMAEQARVELLGAADDADVMVILLSAGVFQETVEEVWGELVETAKPESVWCLGAARSSLDRLNFEELETKDCTVLTYQRVGVASIGTETREELLEIVERKSTQ